MLPSFLITFREVIEASLIVATILGILTKLGQKKEIKTVWLATAVAALTSAALLAIGSIFGLKVQHLYKSNEPFIEGSLMIISAIFITWAVFFLHNYFGRYKTHLLQKLQKTAELQQQRGLFVLVFTAVFREGFEIVLFLSTIYFSSNPQDIFGGFVLGATGAILVCFGLFTATIHMPVFYAFRATSILLILFAGNLLSRGTHEFAEVGFLPDVGGIQFSLYAIYTIFMTWWVFVRRAVPKQDATFH